MKGWRLHILIYCLLGTALTSAWAQEVVEMKKVPLTKNFLFEDGIYLSFEAFQNNQPDYHWDEVQAAVFSNPNNFMAQVQYIKAGLDEAATELVLEEIWGISLGGIPYIRLPEGSVDKTLTVFAGLRLRGKICYFNYENEVNRKIEMPVYNPVNHYVFRKVWIDRKEAIVYEKLLHFESGIIVDFNEQHFQEWIADDPRLVETVEEMSPTELKEKLFKCLLIYVDRNQVEIPKGRIEKE